MSDNEVPPPYSEHELDQKIARALVISVQRPQQEITDDGEWEQWDEGVFAAAEARRNRTIDSGLIESSGSQSYERHESYNASPLPVPGAVKPLRIHKRSGSSVNGAPGSWVGGVISEGSYESSSSRHVLRNGHCLPNNNPPDSDDDDSIPPPFASLATRMDGVVSLEYHAESTSPSPLNSPKPDHSPLPPDSHLMFTGQDQLPAGQYQHSLHFSPPRGTVQRPTRQSMPISPSSPHYHLQQRPVSAIHPISASPHPVLNQPTHLSHTSGNFGQYGKSTHPSARTQSPHGVYLSPAYKKTVSTLPSQGQSFAASALYNSSVSGHLSSSMSMQPRVSHSSRQHRSPQIAQPQPPQHPLYMVDQPQSMPIIHSQGSSPSQHPTNATYFPQYPSFPAQHGDPTLPRWATSEHQLNQNFQS